MSRNGMERAFGRLGLFHRREYLRGRASGDGGKDSAGLLLPLEYREGAFMRKFFFDSAALGESTVEYSLVTGTPDADKGEYGILVESGGEAALIPSISVSRFWALELLGMMCRGLVTPVTALDVAEDWLAAI